MVLLTVLMTKYLWAEVPMLQETPFSRVSEQIGKGKHVMLNDKDREVYRHAGVLNPEELNTVLQQYIAH